MTEDDLNLIMGENLDEEIQQNASIASEVQPHAQSRLRSRGLRIGGFGRSVATRHDVLLMSSRMLVGLAQK